MSNETAEPAATRLLRVSCLFLAGTAILSAAMGFVPASAAGTGLLLLAAHVAGFLITAWILARLWGSRSIWAVSAAGLLIALPALAGRQLAPVPWGGGHALAGHAALGFGALAAAAIMAPRRIRASGIGAFRWVTLMVVGASLVGYAAARSRSFTREVVRYDPLECYRFLTATVPEQTRAPFFPSSIRFDHPPGADCRSGGCHPHVHEDRVGLAHASAGIGTTYQTAIAGFIRRRGPVAARWCRGCHQPATLAETGAQGIGCVTCHGGGRVTGLYGSAAVSTARQPSSSDMVREVRYRPLSHGIEQAAFPRRFGSQLCAACHRKNWSLPQNQFHWMPGQDEYAQWRESRYSGESLFSAGPTGSVRGCRACHSGNASPARLGAIALDAFVRDSALSARTIGNLEQSALPAPHTPVYLDVLVRNVGIGHDLPYGSPQRWNCWLAVRLLDRSGRALATSGTGREHGAPHGYRLLALDRDGKPIRNGELDRMTQVQEWRRIPAGEADLARYSFRVPEKPVGSVEIRLLRAPLPGLTPREVAPQLLARRSLRVGAVGGPQDPQLWREYGRALAGVKAYSAALQCFQRAMAGPPDSELYLSWGKVFLDEGDLLAARGEFSRARILAPLAGQAWEGAVLRRMGQPDQAAALLEPLKKQFPHDQRLHFELGLIYLEELRNPEAVREFQAMLDVDPLDVSAHYNLMVAEQRMNLLAEARREEAIYRLLRPEAMPGSGAFHPASSESRALHVHALEPAP